MNVPKFAVTIMSSIASPSHPQSPSSLFSPKSLSSINFQSSSAPTGCPGIKLTRRSSFKTSSLVLFTFILSFSLIGRTSGQSVLTQLLAPRIQNLLDSVLPERTPMIPTGGIMHPSRVKERMRRPPNNPGALPFSSSLSMTRVRRPSHAHHHIPQSLSPFHPNSGSGRGPMFLRGVEPPSFSSSGPLNLFPAESIHDYHPEYDHHPDHHQPLDSYSHHEEVAYNYHYNDHPPPYEHHHEEEHSEYHETPSSGKPIHYEFHSISDSPDLNFEGKEEKMAYPLQYSGMDTKVGIGGSVTDGKGSVGAGQTSEEGQECDDEEVGRGEEGMYQYREELLKPLLLPITTNQGDKLGEEEEGQKVMMTKPSRNPLHRGPHKARQYQNENGQRQENYGQEEEGEKYNEEQYVKMMKDEYTNEPSGKNSEEEQKYHRPSRHQQEYQAPKMLNEQYSVHHGMHGMKMEMAQKGKHEEKLEGETPSSEEVSISSSEFFDKDDSESKTEKYKTVTTSYFPYVQGADYKDQRSYSDDTMSRADIDKYADIYKYNWNENEHLSMKSNQEAAENHHQEGASSTASTSSPSSSGSFHTQSSPGSSSSVIYSEPDDKSNPSYQGSGEGSIEKDNILEGATFLNSFRKEAPLLVHFNITSKTSPGIKANISINGYSIDPAQEAILASDLGPKRKVDPSVGRRELSRRLVRVARGRREGTNSRTSPELVTARIEDDYDFRSSSSNTNLNYLNVNSTKS